MDVEEFREMLDKMKPEEIRRLMQKQNPRIRKMLSKRDIFWWIKIVLMQILLTQIFLGFYMITYDTIVYQLLFAVFVESLALTIAVIIINLQGKLSMFKKLPS